jgi:hypothetical protein
MKSFDAPAKIRANRAGPLPIGIGTLFVVQFHHPEVASP